MLAPPVTRNEQGPYPRRKAALGVLCAAIALIVAANTSLMVAITTIQQHLNASAAQTRWILDAYPIAVASLLLLFGTVGDRFGRRQALTLGLAGFGAASLFGALATSPTAVIAARALLGVCGALIMPATLAYVRVLFPPEERKLAMRLWSASSGVALAAGPLVAGALVSPLGWQGIFWFNIPVSLLLLGAALAWVPASRNPLAPRIDVVGALLATAVFAPLTYGVIEAPTYGWTSLRILVAIAIAVVALASFVAWEIRVDSPMLDLSWFRSRGFAMGAALIALGFTAAVGVTYLVVLFLQQYELRDALRTGIEGLPLGVGMLAGAALNGPIVTRHGLRRPVVAGLVVLAAGCLLLALSHSSYAPIGISLGVVGLGTGLFLPSLTEEVMHGAPHGSGGVAGATADVAVELGAALGIAVLGSVLTSGYHSQLPRAILLLPVAARSAVRDSLYGAHLVAARLPAGPAHEVVSSAGTAFLHGVTLAGFVGAGIALITAAVAIGLPRHPTPAHEEHHSFLDRLPAGVVAQAVSA